MKKQKRNYSTTFKQKAVELSYARGHVKQVCEELDIPYSVLHRWRREQKIYGKNSFPGKGKPKQTEEEKQIARLKKQLKDMALERDILKKAISIFSVSDRKNLDCIKQHKMKFPVEKMCKVLGVSKSGYYYWLNADSSNLWLENQKLSIEIQSIFETSYHSYGSPRIQAELEVLGYKVSKPRVARIMKANNLYAIRKRKFKATTNSKHNYPISPNLLNQDFKVKRINQVWVSDITYIHTGQGWLYLTVIIDLYHRKIVGWSLSDNLTTEDTIVKAWYMAVNNQPITQKLIFHSDRGSQYASECFRSIIKSYDKLVIQSMSRKGNCWDNAVAESFFKSLKVEWIYKHKYTYKSQAELSVFEWIETWYNKNRRHSYLNYKTINEFELNMYNQNIAA